MLTSLLLQKIENVYPHALPAEQLRLALAYLNQFGLDVCETSHDRDFEERLESCRWQLRSQADRQSAVAEELDALASTEPCEFSPNHIWTLIRAIKVQKQTLDLYEPESGAVTCS